MKNYFHRIPTRPHVQKSWIYIPFPRKLYNCVFFFLSLLVLWVVVHPWSASKVSLCSFHFDHLYITHPPPPFFCLHPLLLAFTIPSLGLYRLSVCLVVHTFTRLPPLPTSLSSPLYHPTLHLPIITHPFYSSGLHERLTTPPKTFS